MPKLDDITKAAAKCSECGAKAKPMSVGRPSAADRANGIAPAMGIDHKHGCSRGISKSSTRRCEEGMCPNRAHVSKSNKLHPGAGYESEPVSKTTTGGAPGYTWRSIGSDRHFVSTHACGFVGPKRKQRMAAERDIAFHDADGDCGGKKVGKLADLMGTSEESHDGTLAGLMGVEKAKKPDSGETIAESGPVKLRRMKDGTHQVHHDEHGHVATIHDVSGQPRRTSTGSSAGGGRYPAGTHMISPHGSLSDEMAGNETRPSAMAAFEHVAVHARSLPSQHEIGERLKNSEGGTDHHYGIASKHVMGQEFDARTGGDHPMHAPNHVVEHKGFVHEYYDHGGSFLGRHVDTSTGSVHLSHHPVRTGHEAHEDFSRGRGTGRAQRTLSHGGAQPHPARQYRDSSGIADHTYFPAKDRSGYYGTHISYMPNTSVAEHPRGDSTAYGSANANHDFHVSYHPNAKSHDEAHMQYLKARGVVKSADGGEEPDLLKSEDGDDPIELQKAASNGHKVPGISGWSMSAGGTAAAPGKHGYTHTAPGGSLNSGGENYSTYSIHPISSERGHHLGYQLSVAGHPANTGLHNQVTDGGEHNAHFRGSLFRSPQGAAKAAREHYNKHTGGPNPSGCDSCHAIHGSK